MDIKTKWIIEFKEALDEMQIQSSIKLLRDQILVELLEFPVVFNLLSTSNANLRNTLETRFTYEQKGQQVVNIWEDQWLFRKSQILGRIQSIIGENIRIGARNCSIALLSSIEAKLFFDTNHLQAHIRAKCNIGLVHKGELVAAVAFKIRPMHINPNYRSGELVRYCSKSGITVVGGLSKLLKSYIQIEKPNDIMTYADKDWSRGEGYLQLGFTAINETKPITLYLNSDYQRISEREFQRRDQTSNLFQEVYTTGNVKYKLFL